MHGSRYPSVWYDSRLTGVTLPDLSDQIHKNNLTHHFSTYYMKNLIYHFPTCYAYYVKMPIGELNLKRALDEDTGVFSSFFSFLSSSSPLG